MDNQASRKAEAEGSTYTSSKFGWTTPSNGDFEGSKSTETGEGVAMDS